ncbi:MAG: hypothetical protein ACLQJR_02610 [Stellaceae bacterium]
MSDISLRLVHRRRSLGEADDLAVTLLFSITGLVAQLVVAAAGYVILAP